MTAARANWRTPAVILVCGTLISLISFGPRTGLAFFLTPMTAAHGWGRDVFALALGLQMLLWGAAQPFAGALADRFGAVAVLCGGAIFYALGLAAMAYSTTPVMLHITAGVIVGLALAGCSFTLVIGAFGKLLPESLRSVGFGLGSAAGSFGQFIFSPLSVALIDTVGWQNTLFIFSAVVLIVLPLSLALATPSRPASVIPQQSVGGALREAFRHGSYGLLILGFFACGFQVFFIAIHLPSFIVDRGLPAEIGGWALAMIGLFNIVGTVLVGYLCSRLRMRYVLATIYFARSLAILIFVALPVTATSVLIFSATVGLLWLSTVPPTSGLVALMFGTRWLTMLFGFVFFSHQVGGFLGVWLGGLMYEATGSYDPIWWTAIALGFAAAAVTVPIVEKPVTRGAIAPA